MSGLFRRDGHAQALYTPSIDASLPAVGSNHAPPPPNACATYSPCTTTHHAMLRNSHEFTRRAPAIPALLDRERKPSVVCFCLEQIWNPHQLFRFPALKAFVLRRALRPGSDMYESTSSSHRPAAFSRSIGDDEGPDVSAQGHGQTLWMHEQVCNRVQYCFLPRFLTFGLAG